MNQKYIMFKLENEECAVEIPNIKEVINYAEITEVPNTCPYLKGVISLRGTIVPILDIKRCFGLSDMHTMKDDLILVIKQDEDLAGIPVDSIEGVKNVPDDHLGPVPRFIESKKSEFIHGIIEYDNRFIMVLRTSTLIGRLKNEN